MSEWTATFSCHTRALTQSEQETLASAVPGFVVHDPGTGQLKVTTSTQAPDLRSAAAIALDRVRAGCDQAGFQPLLATLDVSPAQSEGGHVS